MRTRYVFLFVFLASILTAVFWNQVPIIKQGVHFILDPTVGNLLNWNVAIGMLITVGFLSLAMTFVQKYGTDQEALRQIKKEQKEMQEEMKKYKDDPGKILEFNKRQMEKIPETMKISMRPLMYTIIPFILFFRWFQDYFLVVDFKFLGFLSWFWFYLIFSMIFSSIFRKVMNVA